jgi:hypothetical protein
MRAITPDSRINLDKRSRRGCNSDRCKFRGRNGGRRSSGACVCGRVEENRERALTTILPTRLKSRPDWCDDPQELVVFNAFRSRRSTDTDRLLDHTALHGLLCQVAAHEPAIWHSIIALQSDDQLKGFALHQYSKALNALRDSVSRGKLDINTITLSAYLFTSIEHRHEGFEAAKAHAHGSISILRELKEGRLRSGNTSGVVAEVIDHLGEELVEYDTG